MLESLFIKVASLKACNSIKKRLHRCFPVNIANFLRTPISKNICKRLLLTDFAKSQSHHTQIANRAKYEHLLEAGLPLENANTQRKTNLPGSYKKECIDSLRS